ncbi:MAG: hypothetical protein GY860_24025 [Desulfobacteraceae bacterium]|nr:hypothetical protein [Desulfobacteraceae bacterium]
MTLIHFGRNAIAVTLPQYLSLDSGLDLSAMNLGPVTDGLLALGRPESYAYIASFNACGLVTLAGVALFFFLSAMEKRT